jgi:hypothetical protein
MTLTVGTQLGSFEITGKLGAGGMGEVFRSAGSAEKTNETQH